MFWNFSALPKSYLIAQKNQTNGGFGLVELMVSISIMVIVSAIIMTRQSTFNSAVLLRSQAYAVAFSLREIQLNAVSASGSEGAFRSVLGAYFDTESSVNNHYAIFRDSNSDSVYGGTSEEFGIQGKLDNRFEIRAIRAGGSNIDELSVMFIRPNFDAYFYDVAGNEISVSSIEIDIARKGVTGSSPAVLRTVEVTSTGQIDVK